jgi:large subunit ribosomal protein L17
MKHLKKWRKFGRERKLRRSFIRSLLNNLVRAGKITTTEARAKEIRPLIEKMITTAKKDNVSNRRRIAKTLLPKQVKKIFSDIAPRYTERKGGYTRIVKLGRRKSGDTSPMAIIELV